MEKRSAVEFLRRRYASAIRKGDDRTALRLRLQLDRVLNGRLAQAPLRGVAASERSDDPGRTGSSLLAAIWLAAEPGPESKMVTAVGEEVPGQRA
jgi:hypothetical protein